MNQKQKGLKNGLLENYNELDEMIHNYLFTNNQQQTPILTSKTATTFQFQNESRFTRTSSKNLLLSQNYVPSYDNGVSDGLKVDSITEKVVKNWNIQSVNQNGTNQIYEGQSESQSNMGSSSNPSFVEDKIKRTKQIYNNLNNVEYNFLNTNTTSTCNTKEDNQLTSSKKLEDNRINNFTAHLSGKLSGYDNSNILDNNTTNNTTSIRSSKINSTPSNANNTTGQSTPSYAMGTIVSNNKTNQARRFSRVRPVTAAIGKNNNILAEKQEQSHNIEPQRTATTTMKPWLRHELFTKKQKGELMSEFDENMALKKYANVEIESDDDGENEHSKSRNQLNEFSEKIKKSNKSIEIQKDQSQDDSVRSSNQQRRKTDELGKGFSGYNKLLRSESNKMDQNICDNIIKDCENILNKIQRRDNQLYSSIKKENSSYQNKDVSKANLSGRGSSLKSSLKVQNSITRPQSVKRIPSNNNLFGGPEDLFDEKNQNGNDDDIQTLQKIANQLLKKKLALKENISEAEESPLFSSKNIKISKGFSQQIGQRQYPHRQYSKDKEDSLKQNGNELSQIQELQEQEGIFGEQILKQTPNIYKKSNSLPRSQSSAKQNNKYVESSTKIPLTDTKEKLTQEALKVTTTIAKNIQKFSGSFSNGNQNTILQRPESKRLSTSGAIINMNAAATGAISQVALNSNGFLINSLKRNSEQIDKSEKTGKENIRSLAQTMKIQSFTNDQQKKKEDQLNNSNTNNNNEDKKQQQQAAVNKNSRPATAAFTKQGSSFSDTSSNNNQTTNKLMERFEIKACIGKGSYAVVKLARDTHTDKNVAIKMYDKYKLIDPQKRNNVKREIAILNKLDHSNIIKLYQTIDTRSSVNLVMEYISSQSLRQFMKAQEGRQLEERYARLIFKQLVSAVQYCHEWEVIHRDIKLENVMLDISNNHQIKLIDFGFAIRIPSDKKLNIFCGTPSYMSPEITKKREYFGKPADVWSLGVVLYALVCGRFPFKGKDDNDLFRKIQSGDFKIPGNVSQSATRLINKLLKLNPEDRPTAKEILSDRWFME
ncbi:Serine/Threonine kinase domain protein (macronuclear) [Tetrahymena thermophila SB210]|uniref:Serine/Threonine kinase domain protein n=1 Tax=Tetrahymena thermophila (strain SB210) TaxID=312017 RepID=I7MFI4_TETTS|nr:Serine/Threonine kinase domain protein [Tetrahymena thermophila SB210]EAR99912.2 Serine/Threonine kinase domain protein [Tetrahymena thermophila SB210]|eukprot:XP_001020157.2 Serine/Threonine kinase domain protein [Tetrahymena thermophila SB210]